MARVTKAPCETNGDDEHNGTCPFCGALPMAYFVDAAAVRAHYSYGERIALWGSGMGGEVRRRDGSNYRIAAFLGGFKNVAQAKARAERLALS